MPRLVGRTVLIAAVLLAAAACSYDTSATFNQDGSVTVGLKFLFPKSLMQGAPGTTVHGLSPSEIAASQAKLQSTYPDAKITVVTEGDDSGALLTIPFKNEKDAFKFLTQPTKLKSPTGSSDSTFINLSDTGGLFESATHTTSGQTDTYTFTTSPTPTPSPSPGQQQFFTADELSSVFTVTFALTVPHVITSAPGALFTQDRKTAVWKLTWSKAQTLTATTGSDTTLAGFASGNSQGPSPILLIVVAFVAISIGFLGGMYFPWQRLRAASVPPRTPPAG